MAKVTRGKPEPDQNQDRNPDSGIRNPDSGIQNPDSGTQIWYPHMGPGPYYGPGPMGAGPGPGHGKAMANTSFGGCGVSPSGEYIFRIKNFLESSFCLWGLPFGGIHFEDSDFFVGCPLYSAWETRLLKGSHDPRLSHD